MNTPRLETERLILRKFTEGDLNALYEIYSDVEVNKFLPWFPLKSMEEAKAFFEERYAKDYEKPCGYRYAICLKSNNTPIGYVMKAMGMTYQYSYEELWQPKNLLVIFRMYQLNFDGNNERVYKEYWNRYENHFIEKIEGK